MRRTRIARDTLRRTGSGEDDAVSLCSALPLPDGVASAGVGDDASRCDHVHPIGPTTATQFAWFVNSVTGNDSNAGTIGAPIKTLLELYKRTKDQYYTSNLLIALAGDFSNEDLYLSLSGAQGITAMVLGLGTSTDLGAVSALQNRDAITSKDTQMKAAGVADWSSLVNEVIYQNPGGGLSPVAVCKYAKPGTVDVGGFSAPGQYFLGTGTASVFPPAETTFTNVNHAFHVTRVPVRSFFLDLTNFFYLEFQLLTFKSDVILSPVLAPSHVTGGGNLAFTACKFIGDPIAEIIYTLDAAITDFRLCVFVEGQVDLYGSSIISLVLCCLNNSTLIPSGSGTVIPTHCLSLNESGGGLTRWQVQSHTSTGELSCDVEVTYCLHEIFLFSEDGIELFLQGYVYGHDNDPFIAAIKFQGGAGNCTAQFPTFNAFLHLDGNRRVYTFDLDFITNCESDLDILLSQLASFVDVFGNTVIGTAGKTNGGTQRCVGAGSLSNPGFAVIIKDSGGSPTATQADDVSNSSGVIGISRGFTAANLLPVSTDGGTWIWTLGAVAGPVWLGSAGTLVSSPVGLLSKRFMGYLRPVEFNPGGGLAALDLQPGPCAFELDSVTYETGEIDLKVATNTTIIPKGDATAKRFLVTGVYMITTTLGAGAVTVNPIFDIGNNGGTNNVVAAFTVPTTPLNEAGNVTLVAPQSSISLASASNPLKINVTTAAAGPASWKAKIYVQGRWI